MGRDISKVRRRLVELAFRRMAGGVDEKRAYGSTVEYYRASGQEWAKNLG